MRMLLYSNAERKKPFSISSLTKADWGEPQIACWQLPSEEIALLNFQALVYNKLWRVGGGHTANLHKSGVITGVGRRQGADTQASVLFMLHSHTCNKINAYLVLKSHPH